MTDTLIRVLKLDFQHKRNEVVPNLAIKHTHKQRQNTHAHRLHIHTNRQAVNQTINGD